MTRVLLTKVDTCGTIITCETLPAAAIIIIHSIDTYFVVWTTCLDTVIDIYFTVGTFESYQINQNMTTLKEQITKNALYISIIWGKKVANGSATDMYHICT